MVIKDDFDYHLGSVCLAVEMACSFCPGALREAYRWLRSLAKHHGIEWIRYTKTEGYKISMYHKRVK